VNFVNSVNLPRGMTTPRKRLPAYYLLRVIGQRLLLHIYIQFTKCTEFTEYGLKSKNVNAHRNF
jgi:hypothetical protein